MDIFSTEEAAKYLGISLSTMKYHIHVAGNLKGQLVGNSRVFAREELDTFKETKRGPGRPREKKARRRRTPTENST